MWHQCVGPILLTQKSLQTDYIHLIQNLPGWDIDHLAPRSYTYSHNIKTNYNHMTSVDVCNDIHGYPQHKINAYTEVFMRVCPLPIDTPCSNSASLYKAIQYSTTMQYGGATLTLTSPWFWGGHSTSCGACKAVKSSCISVWTTGVHSIRGGRSIHPSPSQPKTPNN